MEKMLASKFKGCMIGGLIGDCLGSPFEFDTVSRRILSNFFNNLLKGGSNQIFPYTDDTAMSISIASSLIEKKKVDAVDLAKRFVDSFYKQPKRGYGNHVTEVFRILKESDFQDVFLPAKLQFDGAGSCGNGAAMRISPLALFCSDKGEECVIESVKDCSCVTHTHQHGYNGAILQCLAVHSALNLDSSLDLDPVNYINGLQKKMETLENKVDDKPYYKSLEKMKEIYLKKQEDISAEEIAEYLGNEVVAQKSVPTAIYSFLRGLKPLNDYESSNPFVRSIYFAISVGGDTDTIASMTGSIAGAYHGIDSIPKELQTRCEAINEITEMADSLYNVWETMKDS